jgi:hypothetical protein
LVGVAFNLQSTQRSIVFAIKLLTKRKKCCNAGRKNGTKIERIIPLLLQGKKSKKHGKPSEIFD